MNSNHGVENMIMLDDIQERAVLENLRKRYAKDEIYTYIGDVLISVNPFKNINNLYSEYKLRDYRGRYPYELPPHIFAIAESAYRGIVTDRKSQAIIITGESGAGKTEASKHIMSYLASISGPSANSKVHSRSFVKKGDPLLKAAYQLTLQQQDQVKNQILKSNPLLEAFGNAKTVRNNNSSRFGKYMEIFFNHSGAIVGGQVTQFLLEKSRVISQSLGERNFHIFYQLFTDKSLKKSLMLETPDKYNYLNKSKCTEVRDIDDAKDFVETKNALSLIGVKKKTQDRIFELLAAILHMGNLQFVEFDAGCKVLNPDVLQIVAGFLCVEPAMLEGGLTTKAVEAGGRRSLYMSPLRPEEAEYVRDALAKSLYGKIFDQIVQLVNESIDNMNGRNRMSGTGTEHKTTRPDQLCIGILDIYGFEIFEHNSFEQLCINYVNERLQKTFIELTLELEQKEYASEGIKWEKIPYIDNSPCLHVVDSKMGIFSLLNEACLMKKTNKQFLEGLRQHTKDSPAMAWKEVDFQEGLFSVKHYAGDVSYSVEEFVQKNTDSMFQSLTTLMLGSTCSIIVSLFSPGGTAEEQPTTTAAPSFKSAKTVSKRPPMIATQFKKQVDELIEKLYQCNTHYVRCMKPNNDKRSDYYTEELMTHQIRYLGLLENIRVRRAGFVYRHTYNTFVHHYGVILHNDSTFTREWRTANPKEASLKIVKHLLGNSFDTDAGKLLYAMGKTKVFIRTPELVFSLEEMRERVLPDYAITIQKQFRRYVAKKFFIELRNEVREKMSSFGKKRRRVSYDRVMLGDYLNLQDDASIHKLLSKYKDSNVMFSGHLLKTNRRNKIQQRVLMITNNAFYTMAQKQKKNSVSYAMKRRVAIADVASVTMSPFTDNYFVVGCQKRHDYVFESDDKTEIVAVLMKAVKGAENRDLSIMIQDRFQFKVTKSELRTFTFVQNMSTDATAPPTTVQTAKGQLTVFVRNEAERKSGLYR